MVLKNEIAALRSFDGRVRYHKGDNMPGLKLFWLSARAWKFGRSLSVPTAFVAGRTSALPHGAFQDGPKSNKVRSEVIGLLFNSTTNVGEHPR
jgi:hypothetical protein